MALIVKSSIDILPWTEMEKQKLIEEKEKFLNKNVKETKNETKNEVKNEVSSQKNEKVNNKNNAKNSTENLKAIEKEDKKKEVNE